jgi:hypothetical protein
MGIGTLGTFGKSPVKKVQISPPEANFFFLLKRVGPLY